MIQVPQPPRPPFNDALYQALSPVQDAINQQTKLKSILNKYGETLPQKKPMPRPPQWMGDNNA